MNGMEFNGQKLLANLPWSSEGNLGARSPYKIGTDFPVRLFSLWRNQIMDYSGKSYKGN